MPEPLIPSPPEEPGKGALSLLPIILVLGIFFLIVLVMSILLLPDKGKRLLRLSSANPVTQTIASG